MYKQLLLGGHWTTLFTYANCDLCVYFKTEVVLYDTKHLICITSLYWAGRIYGVITNVGVVVEYN